MTAETVFDGLRAQIRHVRTTRPVGRISGLRPGLVQVAGLTRATALSHLVEIEGRTRRTRGEVLHMDPGQATVALEGDAAGLEIGDIVLPVGPARVAPHASWVGRILDPLGRPLDGLPLAAGDTELPISGDPPPAAGRRALGPRIETGLRVFNTLLPLVRGQRLGLFAGSGVGKSSLLGRLASVVAADLVVIALVGERGRELRHFTDRVLGPHGMARSIVVAATSDQSPLLRRRCALTAMTVAEYFRDQGLHVLLLLDSVTRFAEAHREIALMCGEAPSMRGYPPSVAPAVMKLSERAGPGDKAAGDITAVLSVLVAGSDMEEPVADMLRGTLDGHVVLDRAIAERGRFPAVDVLKSVSRSLPDAATEGENAMIARARQLLGAYERAELMVQAGLYAAGSDPLVDAAIKAWPELDAFAAEPEHEGTAASFRRLAQIVGAR